MKASRKAGLHHYNRPSQNGWDGYRSDEMFWNDEQELAILDGTLKIWEDSLCANCGWKFPPLETCQELRYVYCARWDTTKEKSYRCKRWTREGHVSSSPPFWCNKNGSRLSQTEIHNNHKPQAVRKRLTLSYEQRVINKIRELQDSHIRISGATCAKLEQPLTNKQKWRLYSSAIREMNNLDKQIEELRQTID